MRSLIPLAMLAPLAACVPAATPPGGAPPTRTEQPARLVEREVSGTVAYRERIALLPDAVVEVDVLGADGRSRARQRLVTNGLQVPIRFALRYASPAGEAVRLTARIVDSEGRVLFFLPEPQPAGGGDQALLLRRAG